jgi:hypothetical protein
MLSNKGMKQTKPEPNGASQLIPGVRRMSDHHTEQSCRAADVEWLVNMHAYAVRNHMTDPRQVEVTVGLTISTHRLPSGRAGGARAAKWQTGVAKRLAALGYKGAWGRSPDGLFAHFHRNLRSVSAVPAAIRQLQRVRF